MKKPTNQFLLLVFVLFGITSCVTTYNMKFIKLEVMKPSTFGVPKNITISVLNRDLFQSDTCAFRYYNGWNIKNDNFVNYHDLSNIVVDALVAQLNKENSFKKVLNFRDSPNYFRKNIEDEYDRDWLFKTTKSDICISLDFLHFNTSIIAGNSCLFSSRVDLLWVITSKNDSVSYGYHQTDTLCYDESMLIDYDYKKHIPKPLIINSCKNMGEFMGTKIIPTWIEVERMYYGSHNLVMLKAENYAKNNDWIKAAELWNRQTNSENKTLAAKAMYNMAMACEMEGKPNLSIEWLEKSKVEIRVKDSTHIANCQKYIDELTTREKDIIRLGKQVGDLKDDLE